VPELLDQEDCVGAMAIDKRGIDEMTPQELKAVGRILEEVPPGATGQINWSDRDDA
jgi:hypothetical protein